MKYIRGIINNNPANIRRGSNWKGLVPFLTNPSNGQIVKDKRFCQFSEMKYGIRALLVVLRTYHYKHKLNTISKVLHRYAPLSENNTYAYIANVCSWISSMYDEQSKKEPALTGCDTLFYVADSASFCWFINPQTPSFACRCLAKCICKQETGYVLSDNMLDEAIKLL